MRKLTEAESLRILRDARAILARRGGWAKGTAVDEYDNGHKAYCVTEAVTVAALANGVRVTTYTIDAAVATGLTGFWRRQVMKRFGADHSEIQDWNDMASRRKKDVLALVDGRIAELERRQDERG